MEFYLNFKQEYDNTVLRNLYSTKLNVETGDLSVLISEGFSMESLVTLFREIPTDINFAQKIIPNISLICSSGYTSCVYKLDGQSGRSYAVKVIKDNSVLPSIDLKASVKVEMVRRKEFENIACDAIHRTIYASSDNGVIVTEWLNGVDIRKAYPMGIDILPATLNSLLDVEMKGIFEWDMTLDNIIYNDDGNPFFSTLVLLTDSTL